MSNSANSRTPRQDGPFNDYINTTANVLADGTPTGADRLGLTPVQAAAWEQYRTDWNTQYGLYTNKATRTSAVTSQKNNLRKAFTAFASPLLTAMSVHPALTAADRLAFNLPEPDRTPTARGKINDIPVLKLSPLGGGSIKGMVRTSSDASRASRHPLADLIEVRYALLPPSAAAQPQDPTAPAPTPTPTPTPQPMAGMTGTPTPVAPAPPTGPDDCPLIFSSTKANFTIALGTAHRTKVMYAFVRWVNTVNPANSGDWSEVHQVVVA